MLEFDGHIFAARCPAIHLQEQFERANRNQRSIMRFARVFLELEMWKRA